MQPAALRAVVYARLEEIRFRTGMAALIAMIAIAGAVTTVIMTAPGGPAAGSPAAVTGQIPVALPQTASAPPSAPARTQPRSRPRHRPDRPAAKHVSHPAAGAAAAAPQPPASRLRPPRHGHGHRGFPGWWWQAWKRHGHGGWPPARQWPGPGWRPEAGQQPAPGGGPGWPHASRTGDWPHAPGGW